MVAVVPLAVVCVPRVWLVSSVVWSIPASLLTVHPMTAVVMANVIFQKAYAHAMKGLVVMVANTKHAQEPCQGFSTNLTLRIRARHEECAIPLLGHVSAKATMLVLVARRKDA